MSGIHTSTLRDAHEYTRVDAPWIIDGETSVGKRLFHYLSGGGMRTFGRTNAQELARIKHRRFLVVAAALTFIWCIFYIF